MKTDTISDEIIALIKQHKVVSAEQVARQLDIKQASASGILANMRKNKLIVGHNKVWALNHTDLNQANSILSTKKTTANELISIMNSIVALGRK